MKKMNRRNFCSCMAKLSVVAAAGQVLVTCSDDTVAEFSPFSLTTDQVNTLKNQGYYNADQAIIYYANNGGTETYNAYTRVCPHDAGTVTAISSTQSQCQKHTEQYFTSSGVSNGARTSSSLSSYTVTPNSDGTILVS